MLNYEKLMNQDPTSYGDVTNSLGQEIDFVEHPTEGDMTPVICVSHDLKLAAYSDFYETDDMEEAGGCYEPIFKDGKFQHGI
jgi:hypothetical protein